MTKTCLTVHANSGNCTQGESDMAFTPNEYTPIIWSYLKSISPFTDEGIAALMGNMWAESNCTPYACQPSRPKNICEIYIEKVDNNVITITGADTYDGTYTIYEDGYVDRDGYPVAKSEKMWLDVEPGTYFILHNDVIYISEDGNTPIEKFIETTDIINSLNDFMNSEPEFVEQIHQSYGYLFKTPTEQLTVENVFDVLALENIREAGFFFAFCNGYSHWGGFAQDSKNNDTFVTNVSYDNVSLVRKQQFVRITKNDSQLLFLNTRIEDGVYNLTLDEKYYHDGKETTNVMFFEDYALYFDDGMTYREWMHKYHPCVIPCDSTGGDYYGIYVEEKYLDTLCEAGSNKLLGAWEYGYIRSDDIGYYYSDGSFMQEHIYYSYGQVTLRKYEAPEGYKHVGMTWDGGYIEGTTIYAEDIYNYYIRNGKDVPDYITFEPVFEPID